MWKQSLAKRKQCPYPASAVLQYSGPAMLLYRLVLAPDIQNACRLIFSCNVLASTKHASITCLLAYRADWNREKAMHSNYASNQFQSDPNEGFGRNAAPKKVSGHLALTLKSLSSGV